MQQDVTRKAVKPVFPRGLIVALLIGVGMVYVPYLYQLVSRVSIYRLYVYVDYFVIAQIASITVAIVFLNRNRIVSIGAMAVFCVCLALSRSFFPEMRTVFSDAIRGEYFDIKYLSFTYFRVIEFILAALVLFGMNKGIKPVSVTAAVLLTAVTAWWTFKTRMSLPSFTSHKQIYAAMFLYCASASSLPPPKVFIHARWKNRSHLSFPSMLL